MENLEVLPDREEDDEEGPQGSDELSDQLKNEDNVKRSRRQEQDPDLPTMEDFIGKKDQLPEETSGDPDFEREVEAAVKFITESRPSTLSVHARPTLQLMIANHSASAGTVSMGTISSAFTGATSRFGDIEVFIDCNEMERIKEVCLNDEIIRGAMELLIDNVVGGGLSPTMMYWGSIIRLSEQMQRMFDIEWVHRFLRDLLWSRYMYGFVCTRLIQSNVLPTEGVPMVIDPTLYEISQVKSFDRGTEYRIYPLKFDSLTGEVSRMGKKTEKERRRVAPAIYEGDESVSVYVFPGSEPVDGRINSPLKTVIDKVKKLEHFFEDAAAASYWASRPPYPINTIPDKVGARDHDAMAGYNPPEAVLGLKAGPVQKTREKKKDDRTEIEIAIEAGLSIVEMNADDDEKRGVTGRYGLNPHARAPPFRNHFAPGLSHQVGSGPTPEFNTMIPEMTRIVTNLVAGVLKIPAPMINPSHQIHAADAELIMRLFDISVSAVQRMVEPIISDMFAKSYRGRIKDNTMRYSKEVAERWADKSKDKDHGHEKDVVDGEKSLDDSMRKHIKSTGAPTATVGDPREDAKARMKRQMTPLKEKLGKKLGTKEITFDNIRKLMEEHITFNITFKRTPMLTFDAIWELYEKNVIDWQELTNLAAEIFHIDPAHILDVKQRDAQQQEKCKFESEMVEKYGIEDDKPAAAGGGASKPKSKAVGQPAAGKKKRKAEQKKSGGSTGKTSSMPATK
jgi:hypothetical protein